MKNNTCLFRLSLCFCILAQGRRRSCCNVTYNAHHRTPALLTYTHRQEFTCLRYVTLTLDTIGVSISSLLFFLFFYFCSSDSRIVGWTKDSKRLKYFYTFIVWKMLRIKKLLAYNMNKLESSRWAQFINYYYIIVCML